MGIDYYVLCDKTCESFELGKGAWGGLPGRGGKAENDYNEIPLNLFGFKGDEEGFVKHFNDECWESGYIEKPDDDSRAYMKEIGRQLWRWCRERNWEVRLWSDHDCDGTTLDRYKQTGSRFQDG